MVTLVIYDIVDDRIRTRISEKCKDYGLERIQFSAFSGELSRNRREELFVKLRKILGDNEGKVRIYVIGGSDLSKMLEIEVRGSSDN